MEYLDKKDKKRLITYFFLVTSLVLFFSGALTKLNIPLAEWDHLSFSAAENWARGVNEIWFVDHPPLYPFYLTIIFKLFGSGIVTARLGNLFCISFTALILFHLTSKIFNRSAALWAIIFYLLSPICIQGLSSMDFADTSLLPLAFVCTANAIRINTIRPNIKNTVILSFWIGFCLWAKLTSGIALIIGLLCGTLVYLIFGGRRESDKKWLLNCGGIVLGLLFFLVTWICISLLLWGGESCLLVLQTPLNAIYSKYKQIDFFLKLMHLGYYALQVIVWFSPYFLILWLVSSWLLIKNIYRTNTNQNYIKLLFIGTTVFYFVGYLLIEGTNLGFPRYHAAILPLTCLFAGVFVSDFVTVANRKILILTTMSVLFLLLFFVFVLNDPLFFLTLRLKEMILLNYDYGIIIKGFLLTFTPLYGMPIILSIVIISFLRIGLPLKKIMATCLIVGSLATIGFLDVKQIFASYRTSSQYGSTGKIELIQKVRSHSKDRDYVFATPEFIYELKDKRVPYVSFKEWESQDRFYRFVKKNKPSAIIAGLTVNTYAQLKWLLNKETLLFLSNDYTFHRVGTYYLWLLGSKKGSTGTE
jgi:4-amino-4-deoxy-L-arabinose transferase-like glycosyltransferase